MIGAHLISFRQVAILEAMDKTSSPAQTERSKMLRGELYSAMDPELVAARVRARRLFARYNASDPATSPAGPRCCASCSGMRDRPRRSSRLFIAITVRKSLLARELL